MRQCTVSLLMWLVVDMACYGQDAELLQRRDLSKLTQASVQKWSNSDMIVVGQIVKVTDHRIFQSLPPIHVFRVQMAVGARLRKSTSCGDRLTAGYSIKQHEPPSFPDPDQKCLLGLKFVREHWVLDTFENATEENLRQAELAAMLPLGWSIKDGRPVSPWAEIGQVGKNEGLVCSVTGRPIRLAGNGIELRAVPFPPPKDIEFENPDGDGDMQLIITNATDKVATVPALLTDGQAINWRESVVIRCQGVCYHLPRSTGRIESLHPVQLKPRESVTGRIQVFELDGPEWPNGGDRLEFQFCLGDKSATQSFYYYWLHHDPIRESVQSRLK